MTSDGPHRQRLAYAALAPAGIIWGTPFLYAKIALEELSVGEMLLSRFLVGSIAFVPMGRLAAHPSRTAGARHRARRTSRDGGTHHPGMTGARTRY